MQFSFNFLSEDSEIPEERHEERNEQAETSPFPSSLHNTDTNTASSGEIRVIDCPDFNDEDILRWKRHSTTLELRKQDGSPFYLHKVSEENPENEYDLIPGRYEGGSKIWECSVDLAQYLLHENYINDNLPTGGMLELGCGHGLPGIVSICLGHSPAVFLDFNDYVLSSSTWPGVALNCPDNASEVVCLGGDWKRFSVISRQGTVPSQYSLILSAETLYSVESCHMVFKLLKSHLTPGGVALIASKKYYFGVGGGTWELQTLIANSNELSSEVVFTAEDGKSNVREIIRVTRT